MNREHQAENFRNSTDLGSAAPFIPQVVKGRGDSYRMFAPPIRGLCPTFSESPGRRGPTTARKSLQEGRLDEEVGALHPLVETCADLAHHGAATDTTFNLPQHSPHRNPISLYCRQHMSFVYVRDPVLIVLPPHLRPF